MTIVLENRHDHLDDKLFADIKTSMQKGFNESLIAHGTLFKTDANNLFDVFLDTISDGDADVRQYHNCSACKNFIESFGNLVVVDEEGNLVPVVWQVNNAGDLWLYGTEW